MHTSNTHIVAAHNYGKRRFKKYQVIDYERLVNSPLDGHLGGLLALGHPGLAAEVAMVQLKVVRHHQQQLVGLILQPLRCRSSVNRGSKYKRSPP